MGYIQTELARGVIDRISFLPHLVPLERGPAGEHPLAGGALVQPGGEVGVLQVDLHGGLGREVLGADGARVLHYHLSMEQQFCIYPLGQMYSAG